MGIAPRREPPRRAAPRHGAIERRSLKDGFGDFLPPPAGLSFAQRLLVIGGAFAGMLVAALVCGGLRQELLSKLWLMAPLGASTAQLFSVPGSPMSQPWPVVAGHALSALSGLIAFYLFGHTSFAAAFAVALAVAVMIQFRALHPSGGGTALFIVISGTSDWSYVLFPVVANAVVLVIACMVWHRVTGQAYPKPQRVSRVPRNLALHRFEPGDLEAALRAAGMPDISPQDAERLIEVTELQAYKRMAAGLTCADIMVQPVHTVTGATTVEAALRLMKRHDINALPVVDRGNRVLGLLRAEEAAEAATAAVAADVMMIDYFRRARHIPATDLIDVFERSRRRYVVVEDDGKLAGIIARSDLMAALFHAAA